jgi:hypothetical protein
MYIILKNIGKDLQTLTDINTVIFPYIKLMNEPQLVLAPRGTSIFLRGQGNSPQSQIDSEYDMAFTITLQAIGKGEETVEEFYRLNQICDKAFSKKLGVMEIQGKSSATVEFKKRVNQGTYGEIFGDGEIETSPFMFEEIWDCTLKYRTFV